MDRDRLQADLWKTVPRKCSVEKKSEEIFGPCQKKEIERKGKIWIHRRDHVVPESKSRKVRTFYRGSLRSRGNWFWGPCIGDPGSFGDPSLRPIDVYYSSCVAGHQTWKEFVRDDGLVVITTDVDLSRTQGGIKGLPTI